MKTLPRVLHVLEAVGGGTARHVLDIVTHVKSVSHEVAIPRRRHGWLSDSQLAANLVSAGATVYFVEMRRRPYSPRNGSALVRIWQIIRIRRPHLIHSHSAIGGALGRLAAAASGTPGIYTPHGIAPSRFTTAVERSLARLTDYFIAVSPSEGDLAVRSGITLPSRLRVIPNGIDLTAAPRNSRLREIVGAPPGVPLIGTLARLDFQKDPISFVKLCRLVAEECPGAEFVLIGDGAMRARVLAEARALTTAGRFHYLPEIHDARFALGDLSVFVSTSRYEGGPYTPLDAMLGQVPVVLTNCVGNRDLAENGTEALIFPVGDPAAGAEAVLKLLGDSQLRGRVVCAAEHRLRAEFDVRRMASTLEALYHQVASR